MRQHQAMLGAGRWQEVEEEGGGRGDAVKRLKPNGWTLNGDHRVQCHPLVLT